MSPRLGKHDTKQTFFEDVSQVEDRRDEGEQENVQDEMREGPNHSSNEFILADLLNSLPEEPEEVSSENVETTLEQNEFKTTSKQEGILRKLGILYLDEKVTRARVYDTETDEIILREAGVSLVDTPEYKQELKKKLIAEKKKEFNNKLSCKAINERDAAILKEYGVKSLAGFSITKDIEPRETVENKPLIVTTSESITVGSGSVNSSYADRKLRRRLRKGWAPTDRECMCGMPVITLKGTYECVICGVVGDEAFRDEVVDIVQSTEIHGPGVFLLNSEPSGLNMSTLPSEDNNEQEEEALREELGHRLFSGWVLLGTSCPACHLPLIGNNSDTPATCIRCG